MVEVAQNGGRRMRIWRGRKAAFAAMKCRRTATPGRCVLSAKLPEVLGRIRALSDVPATTSAASFPRSGNLRPLVATTSASGTSFVQEVAGEILNYCVEAGGSITGGGIGADKRLHAAIFSRTTST